MNFDRICLNDIDWEDRSFEIRSFGDNARLRASLDRLGIIDPPWILRKGAKHIIVDGFKRLSWAREKGACDAACLFLPEAASPCEIWECRIEKKLFEGDLNPAEKAQAAAVVLELFKGEDSPPGPFLSALGIANREGLLAKWARLSGWTGLLEILGSGEIAERAAVEVAGWDFESARAVLDLLRLLRCSASIQVEIIERMEEISIREQKSRLDLLNDPRLQEVVSDDRDHRRKTQAIRDLLARMRYPRLIEREQNFQREVKSLGLPPSVRIVPPPAFEGDGWKMELYFSGAGELRDAIAAAGDLAGKGILDRILGPEREERS